MSELVITHQNFKQNRSAYCITLREIADRAGVSVSTVDNYEKFDSSYIRTRSRDDNARRIEKALKEIIDEKVIGIFTGKKEEKVVEEKKELPCLRNSFSRKYVGDKLANYCAENGIIMSEFLAMCGLNNNLFCPYLIKNSPRLYASTISKIMKATGWSLDSFKEDMDVPFEKKEEPECVKKELDKDDETVEIKDRKFIFENGKYYEMRTEVITKTVLKVITKEEFIAAID